MTDIKVYVHPDNTATVICPACNTAKKASVAPYRLKKHSLKIRCLCNTSFKVRLDFRQHYRKQTSLPGNYLIIDPPGTGGGVMHICNISRSGIGFTVSGRHKLQENQTVQLEFRLDDKKQTKLAKQVYIRSVDNNYVGCHFIDQDLIGKALGFYLLR
jgi:PilZ domain